MLMGMAAAFRNGVSSVWCPSLLKTLHYHIKACTPYKNAETKGEQYGSKTISLSFKLTLFVP